MILRPCYLLHVSLGQQLPYSLRFFVINAMILDSSVIAALFVDHFLCYCFVTATYRERINYFYIAYTAPYRTTNLFPLKRIPSESGKMHI